jgi:hypothetical protein
MAAPKKKEAPPVEEPAPQIAIDKIKSETISVPIVGTSPLIVHRFSEKEKRKMLDNMQGRKSPKENKDPHAEYEAAFYRLKGQDGYGFPILAFKAATIGAARFYDKSVSMTALKQFLFFSGQPGEDGMGMAVIEGEPEMREDVVRVNRGGADLRYRPIFHEWTTSLTVTYVMSALTRMSVLSLIDAGGLGVGVGEWRAEKGGDFGAYMIDPSRTVEVIDT